MPDSLDSLRDIHLPDSVSWWPLAYGYWVVLVLLLAAAVFWAMRYRRFAVRRATLKELSQAASHFSKQPNAHELARNVNVLLRRAVLSLKPRQDVASLTGKDWIAEIEACSTQPDFTLSETVATLLTEGVYQAQVDVDAKSLLSECRRWARTLPPRSV